MSDDLARAHEERPEDQARAIRWIDERLKDDGIVERSVDHDLFTREFVIAAFIAGMDQAAEDWLFEQATGQRQLDGAVALIRAGATILRFYERSHRERADPLHPRFGGYTGSIETLAKANRNARLAEQFETWLACPAEYDEGKLLSLIDVEHGEANPVEVLRAISTQVAVEAGIGVDHDGFDVVSEAVEELRCMNCMGEAQQCEDCVYEQNRRKIRTLLDGTTVEIVKNPEPGNLKPVAPGSLLARPEVVGALLGEESSTESAPYRVEGVADLLALRLNTSDPRFDPTKAVTINGFLYRPATTETTDAEA